jgi:endonuclease/exonuclease/phosphatase family metal-dependent hydrolase
LGIRGRLLLLAVGVALPLALFGASALRGAPRASRAQLDDSIRQQAELAAVAFERWVDAQTQPLTAISAMLEERGAAPPANLSNNLRVVVTTRHHWIDLHVIGAGGRVLASHNARDTTPPSAGVPSDILYEPARRQQARYFLFSLLALACAVAAAPFVGRTLARPLLRLRETARRLGAGDLAARGRKAAGRLHFRRLARPERSGRAVPAGQRLGGARQRRALFGRSRARMRPMGKPSALRSVLVALLLVASANFAPARPPSSEPAGPEPLAHDELVRLYEHENPPAPLRLKLDALLRTPFVSNGAADGGARPLLPRSSLLGRFVRVVFWNIECGLEYEAIEAAFTEAEKFARLLDPEKYPPGGERRAAVLREAALLREADVVVLNEADWGMKRTDYRNVAADLAAATGMNYAFGVEFVDVTPINLGTERFEDAPREDRAELREVVAVDAARYKGLHGNAILSRFPLENVRLVPFRTQPYDWYADAKKGPSRLERGKERAGEIVFSEKASRSVRRGGRTMLLADIVHPELPGGRATVVTTHLENRTKPKYRRRQLEELLDEIKDVRNPVILAGDMNTTGRDSTPTSVGREIKKRLGSRSFWLKRGIKYATGFEVPFGLVRGGLNRYRVQADPTVRHVPWVAPNSEAKFFDTLKGFRFADGGAFDFRGDEDRSAGDNSGALSNSNQRGGKGFVTTFEVERVIGFVGKFKLDWIFVKPPALAGPEGRAGPYLFAPHFGRTLKELNHSVEGRLSDHSPVTVDLPLAEPRLAPAGGR